MVTKFFFSANIRIDSGSQQASQSMDGESFFQVYR